MSFFPPPSSSLVITALFILPLIAFVLFLSPGKSGSLPPGPPGYPIIGNLLGIPTEDKWKVYKQWARELGTYTFGGCTAHAHGNRV